MWCSSNTTQAGFHAELAAAYPDVAFRKCGCNLADASGSYMKQLERTTADVHVSLLFNNAGFIVTGFFHDAPLGKHLANLHCNATSTVCITHHLEEVLPCISQRSARRPQGIRAR